MKSANNKKGITQPLPISKKQTIAIRDKDVRMLWKKGYNKVEIAKYMGISRMTVASILRK